MERNRPNRDQKPNVPPAEPIPETSSPEEAVYEVFDEALAKKMHLRARLQRARVSGAHPHDPSRLNSYQKGRKAEVVRRKNRIGEDIQQEVNDVNVVDREIDYLVQHPAHQWTFPANEDGEFVPLSPFQRASAPPTPRDQYQSLLESLVDDGIIDAETAEDFEDVQMLGNANGPEPTPIRNVPFIQPSKMSPIVEDSFDPDSRP